VFTFSIPTNKGFINLIPALKTFRAPNWKNFLTIKLINDYNIKVLIKYKKLGVAKCSSLLNKVIMVFKECSSLIIKTLIIYRMGKNQ
jgi:hypothetical protein